MAIPNKAKKGIFRDTPPLVWSPAFGGFKNDTINIRLVSRKLALNPNEIQGGIYETAVKSATITLDETVNPLISNKPYKKRSKQKMLKVGDSLGVVEFDNLVEVNQGHKKKDYTFDVSKVFHIKLKEKLSTLIFLKHAELAGETITLPVILTFTYRDKGIEILKGAINIKIEQATTQRGKNFLYGGIREATTLGVMGYTGVQDKTLPLVNIENKLLDTYSYSPLAFSPSSTNAASLSLYGKALALRKYDIERKVKQTISIPAYNIKFGSTKEGLYKVSYNKVSKVSITFNKGITSIPLYGALRVTDLMQDSTGNSFRLKAKNIANITNPQIVAYAFKGKGDVSSIFDSNIATSTIPYEQVSTDERIYKFKYTTEFNSFISSFRGSGSLYIGFSGTDFKTGEYIYYASPDMYLEVNKTSNILNVSALDTRSFFEDITLKGSNFLDNKLPKFDQIRTDLMYVTAKGALESNAYQTEILNTDDIHIINSSRLTFNLEPSQLLSSFIKSGKRVALRVSLLKNGQFLENSDAFIAIEEPAIQRNVLAGATVRNGLLQKEGITTLSFNSVSKASQDGSVSILLFKPGTIPNNPLALPVQGKSSFTSNNIVGYIDLINSSLRSQKGLFHIDGTVKLTGDTAGLETVDVLFLHNTTPNVDFKGTYKQYVIAKNLKLSTSNTTPIQPVSRNSLFQWTKGKRADFTCTTDFSDGGHAANPSFVYTATGELIGEAFPDDNLKDIERNVQEWRLVDEQHIKDYKQRWHGVADVVIETPYPITQEYTTQSVMIGREPQIIGLTPYGDRYMEINGTGFSSENKTHTQAGLEKWESCVNGVSFYNKVSKDLVGHVPYTDEVLRSSNGHERFHIDVAGIYDSSSPQDLYAVVSTDYGCDWETLSLHTASIILSTTISATKSVSGQMISKGDTISIDIEGDIHTTQSLTPITVLQGANTTTITDNSKVYLRYSDGDYTTASTFNQRVYCLMHSLTGMSAGSLTVSFDSFSTELAYTYTGLTELNTADPSILAIHPGTAQPTSDGWFTSTGLVKNTTNTEADDIVYNGIDFTFANAVATHRTDLFDSKGALVYIADGYDSIADAFNTASAYTHTSSSKGGVAHINCHNLLHTSSFTYYYAIDQASLSISDEIVGTEFEPIGSYGMTQWGLGPEESIDAGFAVPGVSNVPWGLFSNDYVRGQNAITKTNLIGKPKVSIRAIKNNVSFTRIDSPISTIIRGPVGSVRDVIEGNEINASFDSTSNIISPDNAVETVMPLVFNHNPGTTPTHFGVTTVGNGLQAKVAYIDSLTLFSKEDSALPQQNKHANQFHVQVTSAAPGGKGFSALTEGLYQKSIYTDKTISTDSARWGDTFNHDYLYKGWLYTSSDSTEVSNELVAELTQQPDGANDKLFNVCDRAAFSFNITSYRTLKEGEIYLLETQNTLRSEAIPVTIPYGVQKGNSTLDDSFINGNLWGSKESIPGGYVIGLNAVKFIQKNTIEAVTEAGDILKPNVHGKIKLKKNIKHKIPLTLKYKPAFTNESGFAEIGYIYKQDNKRLLYKNPHNYYITRTGKKPEIRFASSMHLKSKVISEDKQNILRGLPVATSNIKEVWIFDPKKGTTALILDYQLHGGFISFSIDRLKTAGFVEEDKVCVGVLDDRQYVFVSPELYSLDIGSTSLSVNYISDLNKTLDITSAKPVISLRLTKERKNIVKAALAVPYAIKSAFFPDTIVIVPFSFSVSTEKHNGLDYIALHVQLEKHIKKILPNKKQVGLIFTKNTGGHGFTNAGITIQNRKTSVSEKSFGKEDSITELLPAPKLAPSVKHYTDGVTQEQWANPRTVNHETIYWSKQLEFAKYYDQDTEKMSHIFSEQSSHYLGRRISGKYFLAHPDLFNKFNEDNNQTAFDSYFSFYGNVYLDEGSGAVLSTTSDISTLEQNQLFRTENDSFVRYLKSQTALTGLYDNTEWQEAHLRLSSFSPLDLPDTTYAYFTVERMDYMYPGLESSDSIAASELETLNLQIINLDAQNYTGSDAPTPSVDTLYQYEYLEDTTATTYWDIQPKQLNSTKDHVIRISGKNLLGNLNRATADIIPLGYEEPTIRLYSTDSSSYITASFNKGFGTDLTYLAASSDARLYATFKIEDNDWAFDGWGDLYIETKWSINGETHTYSTLVESALYVTSSPQVELIDERIQTCVHDSTTFSYNTFNFGTIAHTEAVAPSGTDTTLLPGVTLKIAETSMSFTESISAYVYRIDNSEIYSDKLFVDPILAEEKEFSGVMFSKDLTSATPLIDWAAFELPDLSGTSLTITSSLNLPEYTQYAKKLSEKRFDYGLESSITTSYTVNDLTSTLSTERGLASYRTRALSFAHYDMPRIISVLGTDKNNIVNLDQGILSGEAFLAIMCEYNNNSVSKLGDIQGINLSFGTEGVSSINIGFGEGTYGTLTVLNDGMYKTIKFYPNNDFSSLLNGFRTGGWMDISLIVGHVYNNARVTTTDYRALRIAWTPWDIEGTSGTSINAAPSTDAVMYRMRIMEDYNTNELRIGWSGHFGTQTYEVSHQEALCDVGLEDSAADWWVFAATVGYSQEGYTGNGMIKLYGAREKDLVANLDNARDPAALVDNSTIVRETFRGMQLLGEYDVGPQNHMGFISNEEYNIPDPENSEEILEATVSNFRFQVGRSPHPNHSRDMMGNYSATAMELLTASYVDADISDLVILPKTYSSHEDVTNFAFTPKRRSWETYGNAGITMPNLIQDASFEWLRLSTGVTHPFDGGWYTSDTEATVSNSIAFADNKARLILPPEAGAGTSVSQDFILKKSSTYKLSFDHISFNTADTNKTAVYISPYMTIEGRIASDSINVDAGDAPIYYNFNTYRWDTVVSNATVYYGPIHKWWFNNEALLFNALDADIRASITIGMIQSQGGYTGNGVLAIDNVSVTPMYGQRRAIQNSNLTAFTNDPSIEVWRWSLGDGASVGFIPTTAGSNTTMERPMSGYAVCTLPEALAADPNVDKPFIAQDLEAYTLEPGCDYALSFKAWSSSSDGFVTFTLENNRTNEYLQADGSWGIAWDAIEKDLNPNTYTTVSDVVGAVIRSQVNYTYEHIFNTRDSKVSDSYTLTIGNRAKDSDVDRPAVLLDDIQLYRYNQPQNSFESAGLGDNIIISGEGGLALPHDSSWQFNKKYSAETIFCIKNTFRDDSLIGTIATNANADIAATVLDSRLQGDSEPYVELLNIGHGNSSKGISIWVEGVEADGLFSNKLFASIPRGANKIQFSFDAALDTDGWYWVGLSKDSDILASCSLYRWNGSKDIQAWEELEVQVVGIGDSNYSATGENLLRNPNFDANQPDEHEAFHWVFGPTLGGEGRGHVILNTTTLISTAHLPVHGDLPLMHQVLVNPTTLTATNALTAEITFSVDSSTIVDGETCFILAIQGNEGITGFHEVKYDAATMAYPQECVYNAPIFHTGSLNLNKEYNATVFAVLLKVDHIDTGDQIKDYNSALVDGDEVTVTSVSLAAQEKTMPFLVATKKENVNHALANGSRFSFMIESVGNGMTTPTAPYSNYFTILEEPGEAPETFNFDITYNSSGHFFDFELKNASATDYGRTFTIRTEIVDTNPSYRLMDVNGNKLEKYEYKIRIANAAPAVASVIHTRPVNNAVDVNPAEELMIYVDHLLNVKDVNLTTVYIEDAASVKVDAVVTYYASIDAIGITPTAPLVDNTAYTLVMDSVWDFSGAKLPTQNWDFTTGTYAAPFQSLLQNGAFELPVAAPWSITNQGTVMFDAAKQSNIAVCPIDTQYDTVIAYAAGSHPRHTLTKGRLYMVNFDLKVTTSMAEGDILFFIEYGTEFYPYTVTYKNAYSTWTNVSFPLPSYATDGESKLVIRQRVKDSVPPYNTVRESDLVTGDEIRLDNIRIDFGASTQGPPVIMERTATIDAPIADPCFIELNESIIQASEYVLTKDFDMVVQDGGSVVTGALSYDDTTKRLAFTPDQLFSYGTTYNIRLNYVSGSIMNKFFVPLEPQILYFNTEQSQGDTTAPTVESTYPSDGATFVYINSIVYCEFDEAMDTGLLDGTTFTLTNTTTGFPVPASFSWNAAQNRATLTPSSDLTLDHDYIATLDASITDLAGNLLDGGEYTWTFDTLASNVAPYITSVTPPDGSRDVALDTDVIVVFSEHVNGVDTNSLDVREPGGTKPAQVLVYDSNTFTATITFNADLDEDYLYYVEATAALITDNEGAPLVGQLQTFFVTEKINTPPVLDSTWPTDGATDIAETVTIRGTFNEAIDPASATTNNFLLEDSSGTPITGSVGIYAQNNALVYFVPDVALTNDEEYTATLTTGITDLEGAPLANAEVWSFTITSNSPDTTPPTVDSTSPLSGDIDIARRDTLVEVTFSEPIDRNTIDQYSFEILDSALTPLGGAYSFTTNDTVVVFTPASYSLDPLETFTVTLSTDIADIAGNTLAAPYSWSFTTADVSPPTVVSTNPADTDIDIPIGTSITAIFDEDLDAATVTGTSFTLETGGNPVAGSVVFNHNTLEARFIPESYLSNSTLYTATLTTAITNLDGDNLGADEVWTFTTVAAGGGDVTPPEVTGTFPFNTAVNVERTIAITATFDEDLSAASVDDDSFLVEVNGTPVTGVIVYDPITYTATFTPKSLLSASSIYVVTLTTNITDVAGNSLVEYTWVFTTNSTSIGLPSPIPAQPISIGSKNKTFFKFDGMYTTSSEGGYMPNESGKFIWRFDNPNYCNNTGQGKAKNTVIEGSGDLTLPTAFFDEDSLWGKYSLRIPREYMDGTPAAYIEGGQEIAEVDWTNLTTLDLASSFVCLDGSESTHRHTKFTVAAWTKLDQYKSSPYGDSNTIIACSHYKFPTSAAESAAAYYDDWHSYDYAGDWGSKKYFGFKKGDTADQEDAGITGFAFYNNHYSDGSDESYLPELKVNIWAPNSTLENTAETVMGVPVGIKQGATLRLISQGVSNEQHITHSANEWWLTLNSFNIEGGKIENYTLRIPESAVREALDNNDATIFDLEHGTAGKQYGAYGRYSSFNPQNMATRLGGTWIGSFDISGAYIDATYTEINTEVHSAPLAVGSEVTGDNYFKGCIDEVAYMPDVFLDHTTVGDWLRQSGLGGLETKRPHGSHYVTEIGATRVNGFALRNEEGALIEGLASEESQTNINFRFDQEGNMGTDDARRMGR